jgi:PilZ domain
MERRAAIRYPLRLPVLFRWNDGNDHIEGGFTVDIALDGAFIMSSKCPPAGSAVRIEVLLPSPDTGIDELRIECDCKVTEVTSRGSRHGFVVRGVFDDDHLMSAFSRMK